VNDLVGHTRSSELLLFDRLYHFLLVICSKNDFILHCFRDRPTTTFTVYVTASDLKMSFVFEKVVEITSYVLFQFMCKHIIDNAYDISRGMGVRNISERAKVTSGSFMVIGNGVIR